MVAFRSGVASLSAVFSGGWIAIVRCGVVWMSAGLFVAAGVHQRPRRFAPGLQAICAALARWPSSAHAAVQASPHSRCGVRGCKSVLHMFLHACESGNATPGTECFGCPAVHPAGHACTLPLRLSCTGLSLCGECGRLMYSLRTAAVELPTFYFVRYFVCSTQAFPCST
jgi:hypothetical protein